jgi:HEPN domain-containing protein
MSGLAEAEVLVQVAKRDIETLSKMLSVEGFSDAPIGFFAQQAAEKLLKAWLAVLGESYPYTHNITVLLQSLEDLNCDVSGYWDLIDLIPFAVEVRYELLTGEGDPIDRAAVLAKVQSLYDLVKSLVQSSRAKGAEDV